MYDRLNGQTFSGDPVVDSILEYYLTLAYDARIPVEYQVTLKGRSGVDPGTTWSNGWYASKRKMIFQNFPGVREIMPLCQWLVQYRLVNAMGD